MTKLRTTYALRSAVALLLAALAMGVTVAPAASSPRGTVIPLPGAVSAEGIAAGEGSTFYASDIFAGDIYRGDVTTGTASLFIDAPAGRQAAGMIVDIPNQLLL